MRLALVVLAVCVAVLALAIAVTVARVYRRRINDRRWRKSKWCDRTFATDDHTWVCVERVYRTRTARIVLATQHVAMVRASNPLHDELLREAKIKAYNRAIDLNNESLAMGD